MEEHVCCPSFALGEVLNQLTGNCEERISKEGGDLFRPIGRFGILRMDPCRGLMH